MNIRVGALIKKYKEQLILLIMMLILALFQVVRCIQYPGLYYDAVNPDYMAVQLLYPQVENPLWIVPHTGLPLLGQLYHGTLTAWVQAFVIGLTGNASLWTIRTINMAYVVGVCWFCYLIGRWLNINKGILYGGIAVIMLSPQVYSFIRTQYYIKLPGTLFLLAAVYALMKVSRNGYNEGKLLILSGVLCGLAVYTYFIFIFYIPAMILFLCNGVKEPKKMRKNLVVWLVGVLGGGTPYIIGFFDLLFTYATWNDEKKKIVICILTVSAIAIAVSCCFLCAKDYHGDKVIKRVRNFFVLAGGIGITVFGLKFHDIVNVIQPQVQTLHVLGDKISLSERLQQFFVFWEGVMSNRLLEQMMLGRSTSVFSQTYNCVFLLLMPCCFIDTGKGERNRSIVAAAKLFLLLLSSYYVFSLPFISRMGGQHFTPNYFIMMILIMLELGCLYSQKSNWAKKLASTCIVLMLIVSIVNSQLLDTNMKLVGGVNKYSSEINQLSEEALEQKKMGEKMVYVFPEWGLYCGFNYLTMNQVPVLLRLDEENLEHYLDDGYIVRLCTWEQEKVLEYQERLQDIGVDFLQIKNRKEFIEIEVRRNI